MQEEKLHRFPFCVSYYFLWGFLSKRHARFSQTYDVFFRFYVWALCPASYYLNGLRIQRGYPAFLSHIKQGQCCRPRNHSISYEDCYDEDVTRSFDTKGWSECKRAGYYMTGFYKSNCNDLNCIDKFRCCKMKKGNSILSDSHKVYMTISFYLLD